MRCDEKECLGENSTPPFVINVISYDRKICYEALDFITNANSDCFDQQDFKTYIKLEKLLIK